jgi:hypothetical protein
MGSVQDHRKQAEDCIAMALQSADVTDKALWMTLAQSWVRLAQDVETAEADISLAPAPEEEDAEGSAVILEMPLPERD